MINLAALITFVLGYFINFFQQQTFWKRDSNSVRSKYV